MKKIISFCFIVFAVSFSAYAQNTVSNQDNVIEEKGIFYVKSSHTIYTGIYRDFYDNDSVKNEGIIVNGIKVG
jgi:hypothetical protein